MSVRIKTLIVICLTFLALLGILYFTSQWFLLQNAIVAEEKSTTRDITRLMAALDDQIAVLNTTAGDWAPWDDTYEFISSGDTGYIDSNLSNETLTNLGVELILFINNSGQIVFGKMVELDSGSEIPIPESLYSELQAGSRLLNHKDPADKMAGILSLPEGPLIIASQPILTSLGEGPIRGTLIMGRFLDEAEIAKLSQRTLLSISAFPYNDDVLPDDAALARNSLVGVKPIFVTPQSEKVVSGYTLVNDIYGEPALILRVDTPREAFTQAKMSVHYLGLALLAIGIVLGLVTMLLLERMVITRLTSLNSSIMKIGSQRSASSRVEASGNDEIFVLATSVNSMLDSLERSRAKERESEERYRDLVENSQDLICTHNLEGRILSANPWTAEVLGYEMDTILQMNIRDFLVPEMRGGVEAYLTKIRKRGAAKGLLLVQTAAGEQRIWEYNNTLRTAGVVVPVVRGMARDITERKRAEETLNESEKHFRALIENSSDAITLLDAKGIVVYDSPAAPGMLGYAPEDWIGKDVFALIHPDDLPKVRDLFQDLVKTFGARVNGTFRVQHKSGSWLWLEMVATNLLAEPSVKAIVLNYRDITERKRAEEALRESEERHRSLFNGMMDGVYRSTHDGKFVDVNPAMVKMFGYSSKEEMLEVDIKNELYFAPEDRGSHVLDTGQEEMDVYRMRRKDGSEIWIEDHGFYIHDEQGRIIYHEGMLREITERVQAEALREVLLEIMQGGSTTKDLQDFLSLVHRSIDKVIYAENFFVVLYNKDADWFEEVYSVDKFDPPGPPSRDKKSISAYIFRTGRPLLLNDEQVFSKLVAQGEVELVGTNSPSWMGVPLKTSRETIGVMVVQDYEVPNRYSERDLEVFASIAGQVALVVERRRAEAALAVSEAELRALFASMHDAVLVIDREGVYRKIAPTNPGLLVKPPEELLGKNLKDVFPAETAETFRGVMQQVLDTKQNAQIEYELIIGGRTVWFQTTISPLNADSTLWVAHDITNRKQAEEALRTAEANYHSIFENATVGIYQSTPQGSLLSVNPVMARIFGYDSPEEMVTSTTSIEKQFYVNPADRHEFQRLITEQGQVREFVSQNRRKDGGTIWALENARTVKDANGSILHYEGFITDITERMQAEEELRRAKDALETANLELQQSLEREKLMACTDGLTGLYNHRHFFELAAHEFHAAVRHRRPLTFLMFDMDNFKQVNDTLGHSAGDKLLVMAAQTAAAQVRASDVVARYGGDEFIVMLPHASAGQALPIAERICASIAALHVDADKEPFVITLSIGIAEMRHAPVDEDVERVIQRADEAMYKAKQSGRDRIVVFGQ